MSARSKARKRAVDVLYEADLRGLDPVATLAERVARADPPVRDYTVEIVEGTALRLVFIDQVLDEYANGWSVGRLPDVDRAVLRLAVYELLYRDDVPAAVVIDEAVELARLLSTDDSPAFVNGVLGRVHRERPPASAGEPTAGEPTATPTPPTATPPTAAPPTAAPDGEPADPLGSGEMSHDPEESP